MKFCLVRMDAEKFIMYLKEYTGVIIDTVNEKIEQLLSRRQAVEPVVCIEEAAVVSSPSQSIVSSSASPSQKVVSSSTEQNSDLVTVDSNSAAIDILAESGHATKIVEHCHQRNSAKRGQYGGADYA